MPDSLTTLPDSLSTIKNQVENIPNATTSIDWYYIFSLLGIMILTGLLGGYANYLNSPKEERNLLRSLMMGLVATLAIPLFLKVVDSNILNDTKGDILNYFIYAGCCVLAAFYSARFLEGLSSRVLQNLQNQVDQTNAAVEAQDNKIQENAEKTDMLLDTQIPDPESVEPEPSTGIVTEDLNSREVFEKNVPDTRDPQEKVKATFANYPLQKMDSICKATGISPENMKPILENMVQTGQLVKVRHRGDEVYAIAH